MSQEIDFSGRKKVRDDVSTSALGKVEWFPGGWEEIFEPWAAWVESLAAPGLIPHGGRFPCSLRALSCQ